MCLFRSVTKCVVTGYGINMVMLLTLTCVADPLCFFYACLSLEYGWSSFLMGAIC
jgi:hypothetical protein